MSGRPGVIYWGVLVLAAWLAVLALGGYGRARYQSGQLAAERAQALAGLAAFQREAARLSGLSAELSARMEAFATARPALIERYTHEIRTAPLPVGCLVSPERLHAINAAIDTANAAAGDGRTVPAGAQAHE